MRKHSCCRRAPSTARVAGMLLPALAFLLIPKCPICLAGWIALLTGLTAFTTAGNLRTEIIVLSLDIPAPVVLAVVGKSLRTRGSGSGGGRGISFFHPATM